MDSKFRTIIFLSLEVTRIYYSNDTFYFNVIFLNTGSKQTQLYLLKHEIFYLFIEFQQSFF
jgi:hypothetical protein